MNAAQRDDWALLREAPRNAEALDALYRRHRDYVFRLAWGFTASRDLAGDVVQEVFMRLMSRRLRWRRRAAFRTWLYGLVRNVSREQRRRQGRESDGAESRLATAVAADSAETEQRLAELAGLLGTLPEKQREAVVLRLLEGLSTAETAALMGCREGTVKAHLHKATVALRARLGDTSGPHGGDTARNR